MALADYYLCDRCEAKTFYDVGVDYPSGVAALMMEKMIPTGAGAMKVLCPECAKTHAVVIVDVDAAVEAAIEAAAKRRAA